MKALFVTILLVSFLQADEMKRIESIVEDITKLRAKYEECQSSLKSRDTLKANVVKSNKNNPKLDQYEKQLKTQRQQNIILKAEVEYLNESAANNEKIIQKYQKLLKTKDNDILALKKKVKNESIQTTKKIKSLPLCVKKIDYNPFPKLMPKENTDLKEEVQISKASTFRLNSDSKIYDSPNGKQISLWTKDTSFTSNRKTLNWVKITGLFIDKKWKKAKKDMWVENSQVTKR
ncbi:hypothetical protein [Sulfurimonas sp.]|uniref:hypothetical protein n=1 Tax=Sulfurimonas sp. TaxID=2022749 RepID=UPI00356A1358